MNTTATAVIGWQVEWKDEEVFFDGKLLFRYDDMSFDLDEWGFTLTYPGEFSHEENEHALGVALATVGDYCDRIAEVEITETIKLIEFQEKHGLPYPKLYLTAECS